jgi:small subunit ribosomal protein S20
VATRHKSALKQHRQSLKHQAQNREVRSSMRTDVRKLREAVAAKDVATAQTQLRVTAKSLTKAATKKVIHRNAASRTIARLSKQVAALGK